MSPLSTLYRHSLALLTDLYQLTMAYGYWKSGRHEREAVFHLYFRKNPFGGPFALAAGLDRVIEFITRFQFSSSDLAFLRELRLDAAQGPLWEPDFLDSSHFILDPALRDSRASGHLNSDGPGETMSSIQ